MWRIIDLLAYLLFGAKNFKFTPLPNDCPPDGSMYFGNPALCVLDNIADALDF